jgi:ATP-dependent protease Clp ATPase subunit
MYTEEKKTISKETITQRTFSIDYITSLIQDYSVSSFEDFQRKVPKDIKIQILKQMAYIGQNIIKTLIKIFVTEEQQKIAHTHYFRLLAYNFDILSVSDENVSWLHRLFDSNNINIPYFFSTFILIHSMSLPKINSFVLKGPTNTGKSLLLSLLLDHTKPTRISREKDKSNFHLDQLPNSTSVIFEEPIIDQTTIGTWKLLLEGCPIPSLY